MWRPHPWHGLDPGPEPPGLVNVFVEITPFDLVKYEVDKASGYMRVDSAQRTSSLPPTIYGFIPQTYAGPTVATLMPNATRGDLDPLDICVLSERRITRGEVLPPGPRKVGTPDSAEMPAPVSTTRRPARATASRAPERSSVNRAVPSRPAAPNPPGTRRRRGALSLPTSGGP